MDPCTKALRRAQTGTNEWEELERTDNVAGNFGSPVLFTSGFARLRHGPERYRRSTNKTGTVRPSWIRNRTRTIPPERSSQNLPKFHNSFKLLPNRSRPARGFCRFWETLNFHPVKGRKLLSPIVAWGAHQSQWEILPIFSGKGNSAPSRLIARSRRVLHQCCRNETRDKIRWNYRVSKRNLSGDRPTPAVACLPLQGRFKTPDHAGNTSQTPSRDTIVIEKVLGHRGACADELAVRGRKSTPPA
jgi:hypothetical protein